MDIVPCLLIDIMGIRIRGLTLVGLLLPVRLLFFAWPGYVTNLSYPAPGGLIAEQAKL